MIFRIETVDDGATMPHSMMEKTNLDRENSFLERSCKSFRRRGQMHNPRGHSRACARSKGPRIECTCRCNGALHGILVVTNDEKIAKPWEVPNFQETKPRKSKTKRVAAAVVLTVTGTLGGLTATGTFNSAPDASSRLSLNANVDVNKAIGTLAGLGFGGKLLSSTETPADSSPTNCAKTASGKVRVFLTHYPCKEYASDTYAISRQAFTTDVVFAWVEMPTTALATRYKAIVDKFDTGNPPGVSPAFNGLCYASGQQDATVWTVEIQPIGNVDFDRSTLESVAPAVLSSPYLVKHCVI